MKKNDRIKKKRLRKRSRKSRKLVKLLRQLIKNGEPFRGVYEDYQAKRARN